ncbi:MAG: transglycosylase domain-containing protein, partial [Gemmatimonadota bacterium]
MESIKRLATFVRDLVREHPRVAVSVAIGVVALGAACAGLAIGTWRNICSDCPSIAQLYVWEPQAATKVYAADGSLIAELAERRRTPVAIESLPEYVPQAFIAIEDKRFYRHDGIDPRGIARALIDNVIHLQIEGGGSTITQQLARNMFEDRIGFEQVIQRKLKEARVALSLEQVYSKDEILEAYINQILYGHGQWGIEAASQYYFGIRAADLNPAQAALLAAVINRPSDFSPFINPDAALRRRNTALRLMADQGFLEPADAERWARHPLPERSRDPDGGSVAPYFVEWVRNMLDDRYGADLYREGLQVFTTLDPEMQRLADAAMRRGWRTIEGVEAYGHPTYAEVIEEDSTRGRNTTPYLQGMFIAMDTRTGEVRALIGGRDHDDSQFNRATQARRQPGSVFK